jgi:hypothetical protein
MRPAGPRMLPDGESASPGHIGKELGWMLRPTRLRSAELSYSSFMKRAGCVLLMALLMGCAQLPENGTRREFQRCDAYGHDRTAGGHALCTQLEPREFADLIRP